MAMAATCYKEARCFRIMVDEANMGVEAPPTGLAPVGGACMQHLKLGPFEPASSLFSSRGCRNHMMAFLF